MPKRNSEPNPDAAPSNVTLFESDVADCTLFLAQEAAPGFFAGEDADKKTAQKKLLVAISGGIDSTSLLLALQATAQRHHFELHAAHFNHNLRGDESQEDELYCTKLCEESNITLHREVASSSVIVGRGNATSEDALRRRRYEFLERTALELGAKFVVTGHNLNDQAETVLFRLMRGTAIAGASGMRPWRRFGASLWLLRPMLGVSRATISQYVLEREHTARVDSSNKDERYTRNFIRQTIMRPMLERFPSALEKLESFACAAAVDEDYLSAVARKNFAALNLEADIWPVDGLKQMHQAILDRVLATALRQRELEVNADLIQELRNLIDRDSKRDSKKDGKDNTEELKGLRFSLNSRWDVARRSHYIQWLDKNVINAAPPEVQVSIKIPGTTAILPLNRAVTIQLAPLCAPDRDINDQTGISLDTDLSTFKETLVLRRRQPGDQFQAPGHKSLSSLKRFLHRQRAGDRQDVLRAALDPHWTASHCLVLASGREVLWIVGVAVSEKLTLRNGQKAHHKIEFQSLLSDIATLC